MRVSRRAQPFDSPEWFFAIKFDRLGGLAVIEEAHCDLICATDTKKTTIKA